jgi:hypothetical protein
MSQLGQAIFGELLLGTSMAYLLALFSLLVGIAIGLNVNQPIAMLEPTRTLVTNIEASEKLLETAPGNPHDISDELEKNT